LNENIDNRTRESTEQGIALLEAYLTYKKPNVFHVGDFVRFKPGMSNRSVPEEDSIGIVTEVLAEPFFDPLRKSAGNASFHEPLNLHVGLLCNDSFREFYYDSSRMEPVPMSEMDDDLKETAERLTELSTRLTEPRAEPMVAGDIVQWKEGLKNTKRPDYGQQCIVMETFPTISSDGRGSGSTGFRDPADMRVGILDDDGDLMIYVFDSRRFVKVPDSQWKC